MSGVTHSYFQLRRQPVDDILANDANFAYFLEVSFALFKKKKVWAKIHSAGNQPFVLS